MASQVEATAVVNALRGVVDAIELLVAALRVGLTPAQEDQLLSDINAETARLQVIVNG